MLDSGKGFPSAPTATAPDALDFHIEYIFAEKFGLAKLEFRDQLLVFVDGSLGIRQGELGALRWLDCDFEKW